MQLEAEEGTLEPGVTPQDVSDPISGGRVILDPAASGGRAVALWGTNDAVNFTVPSTLPAGRYTVKARGRGEAYQGWPVVALLDRHWRRLATMTLDTGTYDLRSFGEFELQPGQPLVFRFLNDLYEGPGRDRNAVVDYLVIEPVSDKPTEYAIEFGTDANEDAVDVGVDAADHAYVVGRTNGVLPGQPGGATTLPDAFVRKVDARGREVWTRQFGTGTGGLETAASVAVDLVGNSYVGGSTSGAFFGQTGLGGPDAFVRKYSADGTEVWTRQFGTADDDRLTDVGIDTAGNVYVVGYTTLPSAVFQIYRGFIRKFTAAGTEVWSKQLDSTYSEQPMSVGVDAAGNVYVGGDPTGLFPNAVVDGGNIVFLSKFNASGNRMWTRQFGTDTSNNHRLQGKASYIPLSTSLRSVQVDSAGNVLVSGRVGIPLMFSQGQRGGAFPGQTHAGGSDPFVRKYSPDGTELWTRQPGTANDDEGTVSVNAAGNVYLARTSGVYGVTLEGPDSSSSILKYAPDGTLLQTRQLGAVTVKSVMVGKSGNVFSTGTILKSVPGAYGGTLQVPDAFLTKQLP